MYSHCSETYIAINNGPKIKVNVFYNKQILD